MATNIKVGDTVVYHNITEALVVIERETKTQLITKENYRFKKDSLFGIGATDGKIRPLKDDAEKAKISRDVQERRERAVAEARHRKLYSKFAFDMKYHWEELELDQLERIEAIINENC